MTPRLPRLLGGAPSERWWQYALAGALLLGGPVWHYLYVERYPAGADFAALVGAAAVIGAAIALLARRIGGLVGTACYGALVYAFLDLQFDLHVHVRAPVLLAIVVALAWVLQRHRAVLTCITLGALYAASIPRADAGRAAARATAGAALGGDPGATPPLLVHIVLDEQWGIGGLRLEGDSATADFLTDFYVSRGFEVYPAAYSRLPYTLESLPSLVSLGDRPARALTSGDGVKRDGFFYRLTENPYFERLRARGYAIRVFQNGFMDFCTAPGAPVASCETGSANSIANIAYAEGSPLARASLAGRYFLSLKSHVYAVLRPTPSDWRRSSVGSGLVALRHARAAIAGGPRAGVAYFVHALAPHRPIEVDAECRLLARLDDRVGYTQPQHLSDSTWARWVALAGGQIRCTHRELDAVLDAVDRRAGRDGAIVVVHGDHGSRIFQHDPKGAPLSTLDDRQLAGRYSTLLAVRRPGAAARVARDPAPVQDFVWRLARQEFRGPVPLDFRHFVLTSWADSAGADSLRALAPGAVPWGR